jgi:hypothetical protein
VASIGGPYARAAAAWKGETCSMQLNVQEQSAIGSPDLRGSIRHDSGGESLRFDPAAITLKGDVTH